MKHEVGNEVMVHMEITEVREGANGVYYEAKLLSCTSVVAFSKTVLLEDKDISENVTQYIDELAKSRGEYEPSN